MKPVDIRDANWEALRQQLDGRVQEVYSAWLAHGPCTTRQLAAASGIDILNVRPRTTDLMGIGLVECVGRQAGQGIYQARSNEAWVAWQRYVVELVDAQPA
jgi:hypothetical protein